MILGNLVPQVATAVDTAGGEACAVPSKAASDGEDLFAWAAREYQAYCKGKTRLYLFSEWLPGETPQLEASLRFWADVTRNRGFDGIDMHEAANFENKDGPEMQKMAALGAMAKRLRGWK